MKVLIILFCNLKILLLYEEFSPENYPVINNRIEIRMVNHLQGIQPHKTCNGLTAKQTTLNFGITISIWLFYVNMLPIIILKNFVLVILEFILLSQPRLMGKCELFLVKNCMRLVFSKSSDRFALNQSFLFINSLLMSFIKLIGFGLVVIRLVSSANKSNLDLLLLLLVFVIFVISLI